MSFEKVRFPSDNEGAENLNMSVDLKIKRSRTTSKMIILVGKPLGFRAPEILMQTHMILFDAFQFLLTEWESDLSRHHLLSLSGEFEDCKLESVVMSYMISP